jgi:hypothetical protein
VAESDPLKSIRKTRIRQTRPGEGDERAWGETGSRPDTLSGGTTKWKRTRQRKPTASTAQGTSRARRCRTQRAEHGASSENRTGTVVTARSRSNGSEFTMCPRQGNAGSCVPDGDAATISLEHTKDRRSGIWLGGGGLLAGEFGVRTSSIACKQAPATGAARRPPRAHQGAPLQSYMTIQRRNSFRAGGTPRRLRPAPNNPASFGRPDASLFASARS